MSIKKWPENERPREKLLAFGAQSLSDSELLAIFLRTGLPGKSAVDIARELITHFGGLRPLLLSTKKEFCAHLGVGQAKYVQLKAALEMVHRHLSEQLLDRNLFDCPKAIENYLMARLRDQPNEILIALFLDTHHHLIKHLELNQGTSNKLTPQPREIVKSALIANATSVIFAHNHPSGIPFASQADKAFTQQMKDILKTVDIKVLDHIIIGDGQFISFMEEGFL